MKSCYSDDPVVRFNLDSAYRVESKTRQTPFVVAYEVKDGLAERQFLCFHDVEHFINLKSQFPYCHEIIRCPSQKGEDDDNLHSKEDLAKGRLIFDFDCKTPLDCLSFTERLNGQFVPTSFKEIIEYLINAVFDKYYIGVDKTKFIFNWQVTKYKHKFSMHLIVKHAYFSEYWVRQMRIFYEFLVRTADQTDDFIINGQKINPGKLIRETLDFQIPRKNATFRMIECSKIEGLPFEIEAYRNNGIDFLKNPNFSLTIYDCLVGIYHVDQLKAEQSISLAEINYNAIEDEVEETRNCEQDIEEKRFRKVMKHYLSIIEENIQTGYDITDANVNQAVKLFNNWNDGTFDIRDQIETIINLNRVRSHECMISGKVHDHEHAYLKLAEDGHLYFFCRRGCSKNGNRSLDLGIYRVKKRPENVIPLKLNKVNAVKDSVTVILPMEKVEVKQSQPRLKAGNNSAKRVQLGYTTKIWFPGEVKI